MDGGMNEWKECCGRGESNFTEACRSQTRQAAYTGLRNLTLISKKGGKKSPRVAVKIKWQREIDVAQNQKHLYSVHVNYHVLVMNDPMNLLHNGIAIQVFMEDATSLPRTLEFT